MWHHYLKNVQRMSNLQRRLGKTQHRDRKKTRIMETYSPDAERASGRKVQLAWADVQRLIEDEAHKVCRS